MDHRMGSVTLLVFVAFMGMVANVEGVPCTEDLINSCKKFLTDKVEVSDQTTEAELKVLCGTQPCMDALHCTVPIAQKQALQQNLDSALAMCDPDKTDLIKLTGLVSRGMAILEDSHGFDVGCMSKIQECEAQQRKNVDESKIEERTCLYLKCAADLRPHCEGANKIQLEHLLETFDKNCVEGCEGYRMQTCVPGLPTNRQGCKKLQERNKGCIKEMLPKCKGQKLAFLQNVTQFAQCCDKHFDVVEKCIPGGLDALKKVLRSPVGTAMEDCKNLEDMYSCTMTTDLDCLLVEDSLLDVVVVHGKEALRNCERKGYKLSVSLQTGRKTGAGRSESGAADLKTTHLIVGVSGLMGVALASAAKVGLH